MPSKLDRTTPRVALTLILIYLTLPRCNNDGENNRQGELSETVLDQRPGYASPPRWHDI